MPYCQRPDDAQHAPLPKTGEGVDAERGVGPRDQQEDGGMVDLAEDLQRLVFCLHHVIGGAGGEMKIRLPP